MLKVIILFIVIPLFISDKVYDENFVRNTGVKSFFKPAVDIGCRYRLSERLSLVFEKELLKYIFLFSEEEELYSLLGMSTFIDGVRLGVEMGF